MKKILLLCVFALVSCMIYSQSEFKKVWEAKSSVNPVHRIYNDDLSLVLVGDMKTLEMFDGITGKVLWKFNAKKTVDVNTLTNWNFFDNSDGKFVSISYSKSKKEGETIAYLNSKTGEIMSSVKTEPLKKQEKLNTKNYKKTTYTSSSKDESSNTFVELKYDKKWYGGSAIGSGTTLDFQVNATGGYNWTSNIKGKALRHLCNDMLPYGESEMLLSVIVQEGKVFVIYEGITVLDLATGKELWKTTFDNVTATMGLSITQEIGRSAFPVADKQAAYVCDFSKGEKAIKKLDINTGNEIWKSEKLSSNDIVSNMIIYGNTLLVKFGGVIRIEKYIPNTNGGSTSIVKFEYQGESDIRAYDLTTGKLLWNSDNFAKNEKYDKSTCIALLDGQQIYTCGPKNFYIINATNGQLISKEDYGSKVIDNATYVFPYNGNFIIEGKKGVASMSPLGKKNFAVSTKMNLNCGFSGDAYFVWNGKSEKDLNQFVRVDLNNGEILGKMKGCYKPYFDTTGDYFIWFNKNKLTKYQTRKL